MPCLTVAPNLLAALHRRQAWRHLLIGVGHLLLLAGALILAAGDGPLAWPAAVAAGVLLFGCSVLLHEVVHRTVFVQRRPRAEYALALLYAAPLALAPAQFRRWHLDHHRHLGAAGDPKRTWLSPRRGGRWLKLAYFGPLLFPIYFRAAAAAARAYPPALTRRIRHERLGMLTLHGLALTALVWHADAATVLRCWAVPWLVVFPMAFALNRLGQHYWIEPGDALRGSTRVDGSWLTRWAFLWSNHHLEHHLHPGVPFYRLKQLARELRPQLDAAAWPSRSYPSLLWHWLGRDRTPHTAWHVPAGTGPHAQPETANAVAAVAP